MMAEGLGAAELDLIHAVRHRPGITQAEICQELGLDKGAVARRAANLEAKGYIERRENPGDGRSRMLFATEKADCAKHSKAHLEAEYYQWLLTELSEGEREAFAGMLNRLYKKTKEESRAGFPNINEYFREDDSNE